MRGLWDSMGGHSGESVDERYFRAGNRDELLKGSGMNPVARRAKQHMSWCFALGAPSTFVDIGIWALTREAIGLCIGVLVFLIMVDPYR
jgi:hypothetical protein